MSSSQGASVLRWLAAWAVFLTIIGLLARTRAGYTVIYQLLIVSILVLVLSQYRALSAIVAPVAGGAGLTGPASTAGAPSAPAPA